MSTEKAGNGDTHKTLSEILTEFAAYVIKSEQKEMSFGEVIKRLQKRGLHFIMIFFAAPMALPIPVPPGVNLIMASPLLLLTVQQALGVENIYMPKFIREKSVTTEKIMSLANAVKKGLSKLEFLMKRRLQWLTTDSMSQVFGILAIVMALTVCIPVPLTNTAPSFSITLMSMGFIMHDGLAVIAGAIFGLLWVGMLVWGVVAFGPEAFEIIKEGIKSLLQM